LFLKIQIIISYKLKEGVKIARKLEKAVFAKEIKKELKPLMKKDNYHNVLALFFDWLVIFGSAYFSIYTENIIVYLLSIILIGSQMCAFDNLMHKHVIDHYLRISFIINGLLVFLLHSPFSQVLLHTAILTFNTIEIYGMRKMILI